MREKDTSEPAVSKVNEIAIRLNSALTGGIVGAIATPVVLAASAAAVVNSFGPVGWLAAYASNQAGAWSFMANAATPLLYSSVIGGFGGAGLGVTYANMVTIPKAEKVEAAEARAAKSAEKRELAQQVRLQQQVRDTAAFAEHQAQDMHLTSNARLPLLPNSGQQIG